MQLLWIVPSLLFGIYLGWSTGMWQMSLLSLATAVVMLIANWQRKRAQPLPADAPVYLAPGRAAIGDKVLPRWQSLWRKEWRDAVIAKVESDLHAAAADREFEQLRAANFRVEQTATAEPPLTLCAGFEGTSTALVDLASDGPHALVVGPTGVGKSQLLALLLTSALSSNPGLQLALADFKGGATLARFSRAVGCRAFITDLDELETRRAFWADLLTELTNRQALFALTGTPDLTAFNRVAAPLPRLLIVIDELQAALLQDPKLAELLEAIAARGRSLGIHLLVASQSTGGVPRGFVANLRIRFAVGAIDPLDLVQLGGSATSANQAKSKPGWGRLRLLQIGEATRELSFPFGVGLDFGVTATNESVSSAPSPVQPLQVREPEPPAHW